GDLPGCFAALWTNAGGRILARVLTLQNAYNLPSIAAIDYRGLFPQVFIDYRDPALPVDLSLRAYSPLIPYDVMNSALPVALFVFTIQNESRAPVEAAIAFSWENFLGVGGSTTTGRFADRTGNRVEPIPYEEGIFGLRFTATPAPSTPPPNRLHFNARGEYALLVQPPTKETVVTTADWNALDKTPGWWAGFARNGTVEGSVGPGREGETHPAGVIVLKVALRAGEEQQIPFVIAWYTPAQYTLPGREYGHLYQKAFADAIQVARYALENRLNLLVLTEEWQTYLLRSSLPSWLARRIINDTSFLFRNTLLTRDAGGSGDPVFTVLADPVEGKGTLGDMHRRLVGSALLSVWFPALDVNELRQFSLAEGGTGVIPRHLGDIDRNIGRMEPAQRREEAQPDLACAYLFQVYRNYLWTGSQRFLDEFYPSAKRAIERLANNDVQNSPYDATLRLAALHMGARMAEVMEDKRFATRCHAWAEQARKSIVKKLWNGRFLRMREGISNREICSTWQLAGVWVAEMVEMDDILPTDIITRALESLMSLNDRVEVLCPPAQLCADGSWTADRRCWIPQAVAFQATLYAQRGYSDEALALIARIDRALVERIHRPWQPPLWLQADTGTSSAEGSGLAGASSWGLLYALAGFGLDISTGRLTLAPRLLRDVKTLSLPLFAPTFWGRLEYRTSRIRDVLIFYLDRMMPTPPDPTRVAAPGILPSATGAGLLLKQVILPAPEGDTPPVIAAIGRSPAPGKVSRDSCGRLVFTFDTPVRLTAGKLLEFTLR
ncbi:MAG TPA: GH116 family glycosyl-hydrolase, partial [Chthonomonadales bacterium]|nr:GH116 family glycosyl-hydrolase [Chthonomonadales bacterium]